MSGKMEFREALSRRLNVIAPTMTQMREFIQNHPIKLTKNIK